MMRDLAPVTFTKLLGALRHDLILDARANLILDAFLHNVHDADSRALLSSELTILLRFDLLG